MTSISIFDTLRFTATDRDDIHLASRWAFGSETESNSSRETLVGDLPRSEDNIVFRALKELKSYAGIQHGAKVELIKRIPSAAGLGGGSSDAAAALIAANRAWNLGWTREQLAELAGRLGSDIPYFFYGNAAICRGRGEQIECLDRVPKMEFVVVRPGGGLSTAEVYRRCAPNDVPSRVDGLLSSINSERIDLIGKSFVNRLQKPAESMSPEIVRLRDTFDRLDCLGHQMSGSGSSYFGLCRSARHARRVAGRLRAVGIGTVFHASTISASQQGL